MSLPTFKIFYSWQSYVGGHANRSYIRQKIYKFVESRNDKYKITIDESILGTNYMMIDGIGRTLLKDKLDSKEVLLNLEQFSAGVYYVVVGASVKKIIRL